MKFVITIALSLFYFQSASAQNYPELQVAPKASERIKREATLENRDAFKEHLPIQISGVATLLSGITANADLNKKNDSEGIGPKLAMAVGAGWIAGTLYMQLSYRPFLRGYHEVNRMPYQSTREQLAAERIAEEHIDEYARFARKLKWISAVTNLGASAYAYSSAEKDSTGKGISAVGMAASLLPLLFPNSAEQVSEDQHSYKKKVFGPVSFGNGLLREPSQGKMILGLTATTTF